LSDVPAALAPERIECQQVFLPLHRSREGALMRVKCRGSAHKSYDTVQSTHAFTLTPSASARADWHFAVLKRRNFVHETRVYAASHNRKTRAGYLIRHSRVTAHSLAGMRFAGVEALGLLCSQPLLEPHWHCLSA
jgi:hypothetical protein